MPVYENERGTYIFNSKDLVHDRTHSGIDRCQESTALRLKVV